MFGSGEGGGEELMGEGAETGIEELVAGLKETPSCVEEGSENCRAIIKSLAGIFKTVESGEFMSSTKTYLVMVGENKLAAYRLLSLLCVL